MLPNPQSAIRNPESVRVLLVDDSPVALTVLKKILESSPDIIIVGTARHGREALEMIPQLKPDVVCLDYHMPVMDGLELTRQIMGRFPRPILVISSMVRAGERGNVFPLLQAGAVDVVPKPEAALAPDNPLAQQLINKVKILAKVPVFTRHLRTTDTAAAPDASSSRSAPSAPAAVVPTASRQVRMVAIGASTGGPQALQLILSKLPNSFAVPVVCVQHISQGFLQGLVDWLSTQCALKVRIAADRETPRAGTVYFPAEGTHLKFDRSGRLLASREPPVGGHRPSVTTTFSSLAEHFGSAAVAVLLTGMGRDGADGMQKVAQSGGITIAQDEASSVVFGMPKQAIELGAAQHVLPANEIARALLDVVAGAKPRQ